MTEHTFDPATGEVIDDPGDTPKESRRIAETVAADRESGTATPLPSMRQPATLDELIAQLQGPQPDPMEVLAAIAGQAEIPQAPPEDSTRLIMARILAAPDTDAVLRQGRAVGAEDVLGVVLTITGVRWVRSAYSDGPGVFAAVEAVRDDMGERVVISCGSTNVMTQLWRIWQADAWPVQARIVQASKPTESGYYPLWLDAAK